MDGHALIRDIRARGAEVPAIALTAYVIRDDAERAPGSGFHEHVAKPIDAATLIETGASMGAYFASAFVAFW